MDWAKGGITDERLLPELQIGNGDDFPFPVIWYDFSCLMMI